MAVANANARVRESWAFWKAAGLSFEQRCAFLGDEEGETSFRPHAVGDHGDAFGIFQWHRARADAIRRGCGIDVRTASHGDQLKAALYELQHVETAAWAALNAAITIEAAVTALVRRYERSSQQVRDIARRTIYARKWAGIFNDDAS